MFVIFQLTPRNQPVTHTFTIFRLFPSQWLGGKIWSHQVAALMPRKKTSRLGSLVVTGGARRAALEMVEVVGEAGFSLILHGLILGVVQVGEVFYYIVCLETWAHQNQTSSILWHFRNNWCWCFLWTFSQIVCKYKQRLRLVAPFSTGFCDT